jgi:hypothetical protein
LEVLVLVVVESTGLFVTVPDPLIVCELVHPANTKSSKKATNTFIFVSFLLECSTGYYHAPLTGELISPDVR